jgi:hypothetical protein
MQTSVSRLVTRQLHGRSRDQNDGQHAVCPASSVRALAAPVGWSQALAIKLGERMKSIRYLALSAPLLCVVLGSGCPSDSSSSVDMAAGAQDMAGADLTNPADVLSLSAVTPAIGPTAGGDQPDHRRPELRRRGHGHHCRDRSHPGDGGLRHAHHGDSAGQGTIPFS